MSTLLIRAGRIASTEFDAVLVRNGLIDAIGRSPDFAGRAEETLDFPNQWITYGLHDHHFHPLGYAAAVNGLSLHAAEDLDDLYDRLRLAADRLDPHLAVIGTRLNEESMAEQRLPTRADLDRAVPTRPVLLYRYCGHVAVANSAALHLAGFQSETGLLREQEIQIVANPLAELQPALEVEAVHTALAGLAGLGLTRMTAIVSAGDRIWCGSRDEIDTLLAVAPSLPMDFEILVAASSPEELEAAAIRIDGAASNLSFLGWKGFADGSLGGRTAALYEPYNDAPASRGVLLLDHEHTRAMAEACFALGGTVAIHAIGDHANDKVLDIFEELVDGGTDPQRLRIEHASVLTDRAIERMTRIGITASIQPAFIPSEASWLGKRLGGRVATTYSFDTMSDAGITLIGGSDCPVEAPDPWDGIAAAAEAGRLGPARAFDLFGKHLEPGLPADLLVLDRDPIGTDVIAETKVHAVFRRGDPVVLSPTLPFI